MSTQPVYRIEEKPPVWPCWVWSSAHWFRVSGGLAPSIDYLASGFTHWHPDQPEAPTIRPDAPTAPGVPEGERDDPWDDFPPGGVHASSEFHAKMSTPDAARKAAEDIDAALFKDIAEHFGEEYQPDTANIERIAAIILRHMPAHGNGTGGVRLIEPAKLNEMLSILRDHKSGLLGDWSFSRDGKPHEPISHEQARALIVEQYGAEHEFATKGPQWDWATFSVGGGVLLFREARIKGAVLGQDTTRLREALETSKAALERVRDNGASPCEDAAAKALYNVGQHEAVCFIHRALSAIDAAIAATEGGVR